MNSIVKAARYWHTLKYISPKQWYFRGRRIIRHRWWRLTKAKATQPQLTSIEYRSVPPLFHCEASIPAELLELAQAQITTAEDAYQYKFSFLNETHQLPAVIDWHIDSVSRLWRFNLHYFDVVPMLLLQKQAGLPSLSDPAETFTKLALSWIEGNRYLRGDGWHPYTLSLRIVNWTHALLGGLVIESAHEKVVQSLYAQAKFLMKDFEHDVRGNHLLENTRALIFAGLIFTGAEPNQWFELGLSVFEQETKEQIRQDGGHFERCPSYHWLITKNYLEIASWLRQNNKNVPDWLEQALFRMLEFGQRLVGFDGNEPLLKDSGWNASPNIQSVLNAGSVYFNDPRFKNRTDLGLYEHMLLSKDQISMFCNLPSSSTPTGTWYMEESGYLVDRSSSSHFVLDIGKVCPDYLPAHAHADLFTYELAIKNKRIVVDSGVYEYQAGKWRDYFRSTRAHNTVSINQANQSDVWSSFRVARRATPQVNHVVQNDAYVIVQASHDGYKHESPPVSHCRTVLSHTAGFWLFVDELSSDEDAVFEAENFIHLHPDLNPQSINSNYWQLAEGINLAVAAQPGLKTSLHAGEESPLQGWYSSEFGNVCHNQVFKLCLQGKTSLHFAYIITSLPMNRLSFDTTSVENIIVCAEFKYQTIKLNIPKDGTEAHITS
ncbi:MAG: heparinase II/III family protein [Anaerolineae bacterium]